MLFITGLLGLPEDVATQVAFLSSLGGELLIRLLAIVLAFAIALIWIGPTRVQEWRTWASAWFASPPQAPPAAPEPQGAAPVVPGPAPELPRSQPEPAASQHGDEGLKQRCIDLSNQLFRFLKERSNYDPQNTTWLVDATDQQLNEFSHESTRYMSETINLFDERFAGPVMTLLNALKQRGWWNPEELNPEERERIRDPGTPYDVRDIARHLSRIGHTLDGISDPLEVPANRAQNEQSNAEAESQTYVEDLKRRCRELAEDLRQFLEDHKGENRDEIARVYRRDLGDRNLADEASVLLEQLEERGLYPPKNHKGYQIGANRYPRSPTAINDLAMVLGRIGRQP